MFTCSSCPRTFSRQRDLKRHLDIHDETTKDRYVCPYPGCSMSSRQSVNLTAHIRAKHEKTTWPCEHCPLVLASQSSRIRHRQRKHGYEKRERAAASSTSKITKTRPSSTSYSYPTESTRPISSSSSGQLVQQRPIERHVGNASSGQAGRITSQLDKLEKISSRIDHFFEELGDLAVEPLAPGTESLLPEPFRRADVDTHFQFDWSSWATTSAPEASSYSDVPKFDFDAELRRVRASLAARLSLPSCGLYL